MGGAYVSYFSASSRAFYLDNDGSKISLSSEYGRRKSIDAFINFLKNLSYSYKVVIVGQAPYGEQFSPSHILSNSEKKRRSIPLSSNLNVESFVFDNSLESEMKTWFSSTDITYVSLSDKICPNNVCVPLTIEGKPKFKDRYHLRPFFVKEYMDVLDPYVLLSK